MTARRRLFAAAIAAGLAAGCSSDSRMMTPTQPASGVTAVSVSGWLSPLKPGESVQLSATAVAANGGTRSVTTEATWQSSNVTVAVVSQVGLVTALAGGAVEIRATFEGHTGGLPLNVEHTDDPGGPIPGLVCGVERWPVKTLSDPDAVRVPVLGIERDR